MWHINSTNALTHFSAPWKLAIPWVEQVGGLWIENCNNNKKWRDKRESTFVAYYTPCMLEAPCKIQAMLSDVLHATDNNKQNRQKRNLWTQIPIKTFSVGGMYTLNSRVVCTWLYFLTYYTIVCLIISEQICRFTAIYAITSDQSMMIQCISKRRVTVKTGHAVSKQSTHGHF